MRPCLHSIVAVVLCLLIGSVTALAQGRSEDSASQRILPLPDGKLSNSDTQMQLLQRLRSLVNASENSNRSEKSAPDAPKIDDEQLEKLQQAWKKLQEQLPSGMVPPDLDSISKEQLDKAMSNPAVQQQMKKMLEQFSKDGLLPGNDDENSDRPMPPMPNKESMQAFQDLFKRYKDSLRGKSPPVENGASADNENSTSDDTTQPEAREEITSPGFGSDKKTPKHDPSKRIKRRPDRSTPIEPLVSPEPRTSERGEVYPPTEMPSRSPSHAAEKDRLEPHGRKSSEIGRNTDQSENTIPSVSEFLKEQLRNGFPMFNNEGNEEQLRQSPSRNPNRSSSENNSPGLDIRRELDQRGIRGTIEKLVEKARVESKAQRVAEQLEQQRQQANTNNGRADQSRDQSNQPGMEVPQNLPPNGSADPGLQKSLSDLLSGLSDDVKDILNDAKFNERPKPSRPEPEGPNRSSTQDSESRPKTWNDAATDFLSDLSKAPQAPVTPKPVSTTGGSADVDVTHSMGPLLLAGLSVLGILALIAFCLRRPLLNIVSNATGIAIAKRNGSPEEICSREDVVSAFHALVLNSRQHVESWWTHRAAAQKLAAASPQQERAVQTLAEIYEQARYLPENVELPADTIQSARAALAECR